MPRIVPIAALIGLAVGCDLPIPMSPDQPAAETPIDPAYKPRAGDRAILFEFADGVAAESLPVYRDMTAYDRRNRPGQAEDFQADEAEVCRVAGSTRVLVLAIRPRDPVGAPPAAEVRVLEGPLKGREFWAPLATVARRASPARPASREGGGPAGP